MSSLQRSGSGQGSSTFELGAKKKFGKNLNKLQKPPPPPINNGASKGSGASRNGLLLLSTKRSSSTGNSQVSGLLSSKPVAPASNNAPKPAQPLAIRNETYASTHDALIDAVMGASRNDPQKEPDAWGAAEKQTQPDETQKTSVNEADGLATQENQIAEIPVYNENDYDRGYQPNKSNLQHDGERYEAFEGRRSSRNESDEPRRSESDDNWRRSEEGGGGDEQVSYMARLARERAERRREEEEARMNEQRERARQRLLALEQKMESASAPDSKHLDNQGKKADAWTNGTKARTLYDPNKPYSSLVGGSTHNGEAPSLEASPTKPAATNRNEETAQPDGPVIHISNYEDRDRGERNGAAGPRMLFDPKSGSMVAVTDNSKNKKTKPKGRRDADKSDTGEALTNGKKKGKGRNETARKDRRRGDSIELGSSDELKNGKSRKPRPPVNRLPRTCGVLYVRDEKGACYSSDGCEGDQGYGCHGVPGGRIRNPSAFAKFQEEQQQLVNESGSQEDYGDFGDEQEQILQGYAAPSEPPPQEPVIDWVKRNEKIELLTGDDDSPTLRSTATAWRPSQAALAAALEMRNNQEQASHISVESVLGASADEEDDVVDDTDAYIGLGFDPSNMDSVMSSPSVRTHTTRLDAVDLTSLTLGVPASDTKTDGHAKNIFAFGSSSTWGATGGNNGTSDTFSTSSTWGSTSNNGGAGNWGVLGGASPLDAVTESQDKGVGATSLFSLSSTNTWGTTGLFGSDHGTTAD